MRVYTARTALQPYSIASFSFCDVYFSILMTSDACYTYMHVLDFALRQFEVIFSFFSELLWLYYTEALNITLSFDTLKKNSNKFLYNTKFLYNIFISKLFETLLKIEKNTYLSHTLFRRIKQSSPQILFR